MPKIVDHKERREKIIEIVADMLATVGVENTTIREISRQSGFSRGFIEHYFQNKEEMVSGAVNWINRQAMRRAEQNLNALKGLAALRALIEATLPITEQAKKEWKVRMQFWGLAAVNPELKKEQSKRIAIVEKMCLQHLHEGQALGEVADDVELLPIAQNILHRAYGLSCNSILRPGHFTAKRQLQALDDIMAGISKEK